MPNISTGSILTAAMLAIAVPQPALANTTPIVAEVTADWPHEPSGLVFPVTIGDFRRGSMEDFGSKRLDISGAYSDEKSHTFATLYAFRAGLVDASVWRDRIVAIMNDGPIGHMNPAEEIDAVFVPPGSHTKSGLRSSLPVIGGKAASSGVVVFPHDDWLFAIRMTSKQLPPSELDARLSAFAAALVLPLEKVAAPEAYTIASCTDALPDKLAKRAKADMAQALTASVFGQMVEGSAKPVDEGTPAKHYCRDAASTRDYGVYRAGPPTDGYVLAIGDAGIAAVVQPDAAAAMLSKKGRSDDYALTLTTVEAQLTFASFKSVPAVSQVIAAISNESPMTSSGRGKGSDGNTTIMINGK